MSTFFRGIAETVPSLFRRIFSERNSVPNPTSTDGLTPPPPLSKIGLKLVCNVNIVYGNNKSENSQGYDVHEYGFRIRS
jgi:hypothetical protein